MLALEWIEPAEPTPRAAERFGRELAALHRAGAPAFGADWHGLHRDAAAGQHPGRRAAGRTGSPSAGWRPTCGCRSTTAHCRAPTRPAVERVIGRHRRVRGRRHEPPARIHGDLWPGNLVWVAATRAWLVDPAAHGGHRETDLALLALFGGAPHLDRILAAYHEAWPLADGWRDRVPLHQLHLLLVHTALFGAAYRDAVLAAAARRLNCRTAAGTVRA